jgi:hypothetical protein
MSSVLWDHEEPIRDVAPNVEIPEWVEDRDISPVDVASIVEGGCASGAYMPAVTYHNAITTMCEHGDDVLNFLQEHLSYLPSPSNDESWSGMACHYLSHAVELWAASIEDKLASALRGEDD